MDTYMVGLDCGNSSFRIILAKYNGHTIETEVIDQVANDMIQVGDYYYWDILGIYAGFKKSLKKIIKRGIKISSIGVCTWGVDFALFSKEGIMLSNPLSYRNEYGKKYLEKLSEQEREEVFQSVGILPDKINSVYLLQAIKDRQENVYNSANKILMVPDIINYFLTGVFMNEPSELSTSQFLDSSTKTVSEQMCKQFNINPSLFSEIGVHGKAIGNLCESIKVELELTYDIPVVCVPSHDTASAVCAIPSTEESFLFISSGTWALIGTEVNEPIINSEVYKSNFTNEVGAFGKITLLKNSAGMFIIQRIKKEYDLEMGVESAWKDLDDLANTCTKESILFNVNDDRFFNPVSMSNEIWAFGTESEQVTGDIDWAHLIKSTYFSMACNNTKTIADIEEITKTKHKNIYVVGGGSKNIMLNKLTSMCSDKVVVACSSESTSLGNIAAQLCYHNSNLDLKKVREIIHNSIKVKEYRSYFDDSIMKKYKALSDKGVL